MSAVLFDTHAFVRRMQAAGMPEAQAEALAGEYTNWLDDRLATKADLADLARTTKADISDLARDTKADISDLARDTKADISDLARDTKADISGLSRDLRETELRLEARVESVKADILKWMFGTIGFQTLVLLGAILAIARALH